MLQSLVMFATRCSTLTRNIIVTKKSTRKEDPNFILVSNVSMLGGQQLLLKATMMFTSQTKHWQRHSSVQSVTFPVSESLSCHSIARFTVQAMVEVCSVTFARIAPPLTDTSKDIVPLIKKARLSFIADCAHGPLPAWMDSESMSWPQRNMSVPLCTLVNFAPALKPTLQPSSKGI